MIYRNNWDESVNWERTIQAFVRTVHPFMARDFLRFLIARGYKGDPSLASAKLRQYRGVVFGHSEVYILVAKGVYDYTKDFRS